MAEITQEQLNRLIAAHELHMSTGAGQPMNIDGMDVSGLDFSKSNLWGANMSNVCADGANFKGCKMWYVKCRNSSLKNCCLDNTELCYGTFFNTDFSGSSFQRFQPYQGFFHKAKFDNTEFEGQNFEKRLFEWEKQIERKNTVKQTKKILNFGR